MKKFYFFVITIIITSSCFGQAYRPMLSNSSEWYYFILGFDNNIGTTLFSNDGDTLINGYTYSKINENMVYGPTPFTASTLHLLREDSAAKLVYSLRYQDTVLLYDYNLLPGDTFFKPAHLGGGYQILDSITYNFNNLISNTFSFSCPPDSNSNSINPLKIFHFPYGVKWIEGIGALGSLIDNYLWGFHCTTRLTCHYDDFNLKDFHVSDGMNQMHDDCITYYTLGVNDYYFNNTFTISPNPNNGENILIAGEGIKSVAIYSIQGQHIKTVEPNYNETIINLKNQPKGIYLVKAQFNNGEVATKKLILN